MPTCGKFFSNCKLRIFLQRSFSFWNDPVVIVEKKEAARFLLILSRKKVPPWRPESTEIFSEKDKQICPFWQRLDSKQDSNILQLHWAKNSIGLIKIDRRTELDHQFVVTELTVCVISDSRQLDTIKFLLLFLALCSKLRWHCGKNYFCKRSVQLSCHRFVGKSTNCAVFFLCENLYSAALVTRNPPEANPTWHKVRPGWQGSRGGTVIP